MDSINDLTTVEVIGSDSKEKLQYLVQFTKQFSVSIQSHIFSSIEKTYAMFSYRETSAKFTIKERIAGSLLSLEKSDEEIAQIYSVAKSSINLWRRSTLISMYYVLRSLQKLLNFKLIIDNNIEDNATFKELVRVESERDFLMYLQSSTAVKSHLKNIPFMQSIIVAFIKENSLESLLIELEIIEKDDPQIANKMREYNSMFRDFFFENKSTKGFDRLYRVILWNNILKDEKTKEKILYEIMTAFSFKYAELEQATGRRYYLFRDVIKWVVRKQFEVFVKNNATPEDFKYFFGMNNLDSEINYEHFLEFIFKINQYPGVLFSKLQKVSKDSDAQFSWAMELDSNISLKTKVTSIGILLSLLENALMENNYEKSKKNVIQHLAVHRKTTLKSFRETILNLQSKYNQTNLKSKSLEQ